MNLLDSKTWVFLPASYLTEGAPIGFIWWGYANLIAQGRHTD